MIKAIVEKYQFDNKSDRLGPDCLFTHWKLYFRTLMMKVCKKKFNFFSDTSIFRPGAYAVACSKISIGKGVIIRPGTMLFADPRDEYDGRIIIEDDVMIGSGVHMYVANHKFDDTTLPIIEQGHLPPKSITIKNGSWIGSNTILLPGVVIGKNAVVGAGSIVTRSVPDFCVAVGNPAKIIKNLKKDD